MVLMAVQRHSRPHAKEDKGKPTLAQRDMSYLRGAQESWRGAERADAASQLRCVPFPLGQAQVPLMLKSHAQPRTGGTGR